MAQTLVTAGLIYIYFTNFTIFSLKLTLLSSFSRSVLCLRMPSSLDSSTSPELLAGSSFLTFPASGGGRGIIIQHCICPERSVIQTRSHLRLSQL